MAQGNMFTQVMYNGQTSAYATAATVNTELGRVQNVRPSDANGHIYDYGLGEGLNPSNTYLGPYTSGFEIEFNPTDFDFLKHWVGPKTGAGTSGDPYILTEATDIALATTSLQPFTMEAANVYESTDTADQYIGCVGSSFTLSGEIGSKVSCSASAVARSSTQSQTATSYTPVTDSAFIVLNGTYKWGATPSALSGVRRFSITMTNNLIVDTRSLDNRFIDMPVIGIRVYNFEIDIIMTSSLYSTIVTNFYGQTPSSGPVDGSSSVSPTANLEFKVELVNGGNYANLWLDNCSIDEISKPQSLGGGVVVMSVRGTSRGGRSSVPITWWSQ